MAEAPNDVRLNGRTRQEWLDAAARAFTPRLDRIGTVPPIRISCGLPSTKAFSTHRRVVGECWPASASADQTTEIFISPTQDDPFEVAHTLLHELVHAVVGTKHGHNATFRRAMHAVGLVGRPTASRPGDELATYLRKQLLPELGPYPHARLDSIANLKKQTTRLLKACCSVDGGYTIRLTARWARFKTPICPCHVVPMTVDWPALWNASSFTNPRGEDYPGSPASQGPGGNPTIRNLRKETKC